ncbi:BatD family protein [Pseudomonadales bacterium]|nr:BatD family protein [Pseudomonadales bacterium]
MVNQNAMINYLRAVILLFTLFSLSTTVFALSVTVERQIIPMSETLRLTITDNSGEDPNDINLSAIEANFSIVNESSQSSFSMVNGRTESVRVRSLTLAPRQLGSTLIPPLTLGKKTSKPIKITVIKALPAASELNDQSVMIESSLDKSEVVVGGQLIYTYRVIYRVQLNNAEISQPSIADADITPLQDKNYTRLINGINYNVTEKRYAIFFSQSGQKNIPSQSLTGLLSSNQRRNFSFDPFARGSEIRLESKPLALNVLAKPRAPSGLSNGKNTTWLPAAKIEINEETTTSQTSRVGEPITRSIIIMAQGLPAELLPTISLETPDGINHYPEKPELVNQEFIGGIAGKRTDTIAMVPTKAGNFTLPAINLAWWNTQSQRWETASLAERTLTVLPPEVSSEQSNSITSKPIIPNNKNELKENNGGTLALNDSNQSIWMPIALVAMTGWIITLLYLLLRPTITKPQAEATSKKIDNDADSLKVISKQLKIACNNNDAANAKQQLQLWLSAYKNRHSISGQLPTEDASHLELHLAIAALDNHLFNQHTDSVNWDGAKLTNAIQTLTALSYKTDNKTNKPHLEPLYPESYSEKTNP